MRNFFFLVSVICILSAASANEYDQVDCHQCKFPFNYNGVEYNSCTADYDDHLWCATEVDNDLHATDFGWCTSLCAPEDQHEDATVSCDQCKFPFSYNGVEYSSCKMEEDDSSWCATELDHEGEIYEWGWCAGNCTIEDQEDGTIDCDQCKFPFTYKGVEYDSCTMEDEDHPWCATEVDEVGGIHHWGWCRGNCTTEEQEQDGTVGCDQCQFPFSYNGVEYHSCTTDFEDHLWCATGLNDLGEMTDYGWCRESCSPEEHIHDGNHVTVSCDICKFPFTYKGVVHNSCTMEDGENLWCATELEENGEIEEWGWCRESCG